MDKEPLCQLTFFMPNLDGGGAERVMIDLANYFAGNGCAVDLVLATHGAGPYARNLSGSVRLIELGASGCFASIPALRKHLRKTRPQVLISTLRHANLAAIVANRLAGRRCGMIVREANAVSPKGGNLAGKAALMHFFMRLLYPLADFITANSVGLSKELAEHVKVRPGKIRVIENPVFTNEFDRLTQEDINDEWLEDATIPVILGCGRLTAQKDFSTLIRSISLVRKSRPVRLIILGEGEDRESLTKLVIEEKLQDFIKLPGFVKNPFPYMRKCDCFVLSSLYEGCPNVLIQALLVGAKVVSTDCPWGPNEILENGKLGQLVPVGDAGQLAEAIIKTIDMGYQLQTEAVVILKRKYSISSVARKFTVLFDELSR